MGDETGDRGRLLRTWKEIGAHLGVSDRTARSWEEEGIPVYREGTGPRPVVVAYTNELDRWQRARLETKSAERKRVPRSVVGVALGLTALAITVGAVVTWFLRTQDARAWDPAQVVVTTEGLEVRDEKGTTIQTVRIPELPLTAYGPRAKPSDPASQLIEDVDADGVADVFVVRRRSSGEGNDEIWRIEPNGTVSWKFEFDAAIRHGGETYSGFRVAGIVGVVEYEAKPLLVAVGSHRKWFPSRMALIDPQTGLQVGREYRHPGWIESARLWDLEGDGIKEIIFAGMNNPGAVDTGPDGFPFLAVLRVPFPEATAEKANFLGSPNESHYFLFPRLDAVLQAHGASKPYRITIQGDDRVEVEVGYGHDFVAYRFNSELAFLEPGRVSSGLTTLHRELRDELDHELSDEELNHWMNHVIPFDGAPDGNSEEVLERMAGNWE